MKTEEINGKELVVREPDSLSITREPTVVLEEAKKAAAALNDVISKKKNPLKFNGEQYLEFEDWQTVGRFYRVTCKVEGEAEPVTIGDVVGFRAAAVALCDGEIVSRAVAYCMKDEPNWEQKPIYQMASMAQTRACAKALRNVLSWVVVLAGYRPTPAEEMEARQMVSMEAKGGERSRPKPKDPPNVDLKTGKPVRIEEARDVAVDVAEDVPAVPKPFPPSGPLVTCPIHNEKWKSGKFGLFHEPEHPSDSKCNEAALGTWLWKNHFMPAAKKAGMKDIIDIQKWYQSVELPGWKEMTPLQWVMATDRMSELAAREVSREPGEDDDVPY